MQTDSTQHANCFLFLRGSNNRNQLALLLGEMAAGLPALSKAIGSSFSLGNKTIRSYDISIGLTFLSQEYVLVSSSELNHIILFQHVWHLSSLLLLLLLLSLLKVNYESKG